MAETSPGTSSAEGTGATDSGLVSTQLTVLVPSFDPAKDDLEQYSKKVEMLTEIWRKEVQ